MHDMKLREKKLDNKEEILQQVAIRLFCRYYSGFMGYLEEIPLYDRTRGTIEEIFTVD